MRTSIEVAAVQRSPASRHAGEVRQHRALPRVQHAQPPALALGQRAGLQGDDRGRELLPPAHVDLVTHLLERPPRGMELVTAEQTALSVRDRGDSVQALTASKG